MATNQPKKAEVWRERVLAQQAGGQSARGWCETNGCPEHAFYRWRAKVLQARRCGARSAVRGRSSARGG